MAPRFNCVGNRGHDVGDPPRARRTAIAWRLRGAWDQPQRAPDIERPAVRRKLQIGLQPVGVAFVMRMRHEGPSQPLMVAWFGGSSGLLRLLRPPKSLHDALVGELSRRLEIGLLDVVPMQARPLMPGDQRPVVREPDVANRLIGGLAQRLDEGASLHIPQANDARRAPRRHHAAPRAGSQLHRGAPVAILPDGSGLQELTGHGPLLADVGHFDRLRRRHIEPRTVGGKLDVVVRVGEVRNQRQALGGGDVKHLNRGPIAGPQTREHGESAGVPTHCVHADVLHIDRLQSGHRLAAETIVKVVSVIPHAMCQPLPQRGDREAPKLHAASPLSSRASFEGRTSRGGLPRRG